MHISLYLSYLQITELLISRHFSSHFITFQLLYFKCFFFFSVLYYSLLLLEILLMYALDNMILTHISLSFCWIFSKLYLFFWLDYFFGSVIQVTVSSCPTPCLISNWQIEPFNEFFILVNSQICIWLIFIVSIFLWRSLISSLNK